MEKEDFAKRLLKVVYKTGKTVTQIGKECGVHKSLIYTYLSTDTQALPNAYNLAKLCKGLNVSADYLLFGKVEE